MTDAVYPISAQPLRVSTLPLQSQRRPAAIAGGSWIPDMGHGHRTRLPGAAQAPRSDARPDRRDIRHSCRLSRRASHLPRRGPQVLGPAGGYSIFTSLVTGFMYIFGFSVAAVVGSPRGRSISPRGCSVIWWSPVAPAWPCIWPGSPPGWPSSSPWWPLVRDRVCRVRVRRPDAAQSRRGDRAPGTFRPALDNWAATHADKVICDFSYNGRKIPHVPCGHGQTRALRQVPRSNRRAVWPPCPRTRRRSSGHSPSAWRI